MFEAGLDQAAGLRAHTLRQGPALLAVASPAQPALAYELLCHLSAQLRAQGRLPVILDGTATETAERRSGDGSHLGLLHALNDPAISGLGHPADGHEWLVMPAAQGLRALQRTALTAGGTVALSRLLAPFTSGTLLLFFAPAHELSPLCSDLQARVVVPVLPHPQAAIDAYGAVKLLHMAGARPVLAPMASADPGQAPDTLLATVCDCADRHLGLDLERWSEPVWAACAQEHALTRPQRLDTFHGLRDNRFAATGPSPVGAMPSLWS
ncbi:hypothetical protein [Hydrogenophaga sp. H7]|uniref:hypothetical protein n=1 Tax=Hydrogenophaga sp. H7 TaxID=1882399 RepID=UPI0009A361FC|nr:hypothetical protein [Hydrogenophaga sp. H7]OPF62498.1 hypothetical protein BC358_14055 [Hydrogenophaga sp. H7]